MPPLVKICGLRSTEAAQKAVDSGADLLGVIMVPNRKRTVSLDVAKEIADITRVAREKSKSKFQTVRDILEHLSTLQFSSHNDYFKASTQLIKENGPFMVGVFRNQSIEDVFRLADECKIDIIQLHGSEDIEEYLSHSPDLRYGFIKRYVIPDHVESMQSFFPQVVNSKTPGFLLPLLDSEAGGEGQVIDWSLINSLDGKFILAGGLNPTNLSSTKPYLANVVAFDVSGGVENEAGEKDIAKIGAFVASAKSL